MLSSSSSPPPHLLRLLFLSLVLCSFHVGFASSSQSVGLGYRLVSIQEAPNGGLIGHLQVKGTTSTYGPDIPHLQLYVKLETPDRLRVHITDAAKQRWEVPYNLLPREQPPLLKNTIGGTSTPPTTQEYVGPNLIFSCTSDPFGFAIKRRSDGEVLFNSTSNKDDPFGDLVFKDQYLEISTRLPESASLYGLGENTQPGGIKLQPNDPYTLYTTDISAINLNIDLYGSHPVYMDLRNKGGVGSAHGVLLLNSNGMDVMYRGGSLTYKAIGGVFDFYFFGGTRPLDVVNQYTSFVGRPAPMPYWALGFHQCRWGYPNISYVEGVVENYKKARIPLDVIWNDDDHMDAAKDFTLDPINYPHDKVVAFLDKIHSRGMKYIVLIDPGINVNSTYATYNRGMSSDVFIKYEGEPFLAQVWPGPVYFPDFLNPKTVQWWVDEIQRFHKLVPVDGLWIDMNEVSNFCTGKCEMPKDKLCPDPKSKEPWLCCLSCTNITKTRWDEPPYKINASGIQAPIGYKTIATSAVHYNGVLEYDAHSLYGFSQTIATHKALLGLEGKRPFILTRSTYVGSGAYAAHWTGDNKGTWEDLRYSISTILNFGIFGVPMTGSDICGFYPAPTEELCNRWIELGAFYPFSRDHANFASPRQELYVWDSVATSARNALGLRYRLLPYLYTLNYDAHVTGAPIARPLFFTFPNMERVYNMSTQFLLGERVMVSPVLTQGATSVKALFPKGTWYNLFDMTKAVRVMEDDGQYVVLDAPLNEINVHVCEGAILPMQRGGYTSAEARKTPFTLVVAFPMGASEAEARGSVFVDEDERPVMRVEDGYATRVEFYAKVSAKTVMVMSEVEAGKYSLEEGMVIEKVCVLGLEGSAAGEVVIEVDGMPYSGDVSSVHVIGGSSSTLERLEGGGKMKAVVVEVAGLNIPLGKKFVFSWKLGVTN